MYQPKKHCDDAIEGQCTMWRGFGHVGEAARTAFVITSARLRRVVGMNAAVANCSSRSLPEVLCKP